MNDSSVYAGKIVGYCLECNSPIRIYPNDYISCQIGLSGVRWIDNSHMHIKEKQ